MTVELTVEARVLGERADSGIGSVEIELPSPRLTVADLVRIAVEEQIRTLTVRRRLAAAEIQERLSRQYPSEKERAGRVKVPAIDSEHAVERALHACRAGRCFVILGGQPVTDLDQEVTLAPETSVQFLRLVPLAGG